jgi:hypothetical protein
MLPIKKLDNIKNVKNDNLAVKSRRRADPKKPLLAKT